MLGSAAHRHRVCDPTEQEYEPPSGALEQAIEAEFGALDALQKQFNAKAAGVQVGWGQDGVSSRASAWLSRSGQCSSSCWAGRQAWEQWARCGQVHVQRRRGAALPFCLCCGPCLEHIACSASADVLCLEHSYCSNWLRPAGIWLVLAGVQPRSQELGKRGHQTTRLGSNTHVLHHAMMCPRVAHTAMLAVEPLPACVVEPHQCFRLHALS